MKLSNYKRYIGFVLVFVMAIATGLAVGKIYVDSIEVVSIVSANEEELRESEADVEMLVSSSKTKKPDAFTAVELYNIAEYNLYHADQYYKLMTGTVNAPMGIKQEMRSEKLHRDGKLVFNKLSPSTSSLAPSICSQVIYDYTNELIKINSNGKFDSNSKVIKGIFDQNNFKDYTLQEYKDIFTTHPTNVMPYIISSKTCAQNKVSAVTSNGDGTFSFKIVIDGDYLALAGLYYAHEIKFSSGMSDAPKWIALEMDVTIDSNYNFVSIEYDETYKMNAPVIGMATVRDIFVDHFEFVDLPELEEVLY